MTEQDERGFSDVGGGVGGGEFWSSFAEAPLWRSLLVFVVLLALPGYPLYIGFSDGGWRRCTDDLPPGQTYDVCAHHITTRDFLPGTAEFQQWRP